MKNAERGFTLIEMVVAFAILGLTLTALYGTFENALSRTLRDSRLAEATLLAQSTLARIGTEWPIGSGQHTGTWSGFSYETWEGDKSDATLPTQRVAVEVRWVEGTNHRSIGISALRLAPQVAP